MLKCHLKQADGILFEVFYSLMFCQRLAAGTPVVVAFVLMASTTARAQPPDRAELEQRARLASELVELRARYFDGTFGPLAESAESRTPSNGHVGLDDAFLELAGAAIELESLQRLLDAVRSRRAERAPLARIDPPSDLDPEQTAEWRRWLAQTLALEDRADGQLERILVGVLEGLAAAPGFTGEALRSQFAAIAELNESNQSPARALFEAEQRSWLSRYRDAALRKMTRVGDVELDRLVEQDLAEWVSVGSFEAGSSGPNPSEPYEPYEAAGRRVRLARSDRLQRALPVLPAVLAAEVRSSLSSSPEPTTTDRVPAAAVPPIMLPSPEQSSVALNPAQQSLNLALREVESSEGIRRRRVSKELGELAGRVETLSRDLEAANARSRFEPARAESFDRAYVQARSLIHVIRTWWQNHREEMETLEQQSVSLRESIPSPDARAEASAQEGLAWSELLVELERVLGGRQQNLADEEGHALSLLDQTLASRRGLRTSISRSARVSRVEEVQREFLEEAVEVPMWLTRELTLLGRWVVSLRSNWNELDTLRNLLSRSLDLLALLLAWIYVRARAVSWLRKFVEALTRRVDEDSERWGLSRSVPPRRRELEPIALASTDVVGGLIFHYFLLPRSLLLAFLVLLWVSRRLYLAISSIVGLVIARSRSKADSLTGEIPLTLQSKALILRTSRWVLLWWILFTLLSFSAWPLARAYWWERLIFYVGWGVFALVAVILLKKWSGAVRAYIVDHSERNWFTVRLAKKNVSWLRSLAASALGVVYLMGRVVFRLAVHFGWFKDLDVSIARSRLRISDARHDPLTPSARSRIASERGPTMTRAEDLSHLREHYLSWKSEGRRGMVAIIGDRGAGKTSFLEQVTEILPQSEGCRVIFVDVEPKLRSSDFREALLCFTKPLGIELPDGTGRTVVQKTLQEKLNEISPAVVVVDDLHYLLRRTVGGFETLKFFLNIMQASSDRHFWIVGLHRSAWRYVQAVSESVKSGFRDQILLSKFSVKQLSDFLVARTRDAGFEPDYQTLVPARVLEEDPTRAENRAAATYWQLLSQSALGNPTVALSYWLSSLSPKNSENGSGDESTPASAVKDARDDETVEVHLFEPHLASEVETMSDDYLFVLTALVIHDGLSLMELSDVLNMPVERLQLSCQHLESLSMLRRDGKFYNVAESWLPAILHVLDQKNFAHT